MKVCLECEHVFASGEWICPMCGYTPVRLDGFFAHAPKFANSGGGFKPEYFANLAELEASNFWFVARNELILWALSSYGRDVRSFLEVGCGTGFVLSGVADEHPEMLLNGSEIFLDGLSYAASRVPSAQFMQMDARQIPFSDDFDAIGAFDVLEHIQEDEKVLDQLYRALKPGGLLILTVPQHPSLWSASDDYACHVRRYTALDLHQKVADAGFCIERSTSFVSLLLPAMFASRRKQRMNSSNVDVTEELRLPWLINQLFLGLMRLEIKMIQKGVSFAMGGSRLLVARKIPSSFKNKAQP